MKYSTEQLQEIKKSILSIGRTKTCKKFNISMSSTYKIVNRKEKIRKKPVRLNDESVDKLCKLYQSGMSLIDIGKKMNVSWRTVLRWVDRRNLERQRSGFTDEELNQLTELLKTDMSYGQIGIKMGMTGSKISGTIRTHQLRRKK